MAKEDRRILGNAVAKNNRDTKNNIRDSRIITGNKNYLNRKKSLLDHMVYRDNKVSIINNALGVQPVSRIYKASTSIISCVNTLTETAMFSFLIPANTSRVDNIIRAKVYGVMTNGTPGDQITFKVKENTTVVQSFANSPVVTLSNVPWHWDFWMGVRQIGSSAINPYYTDIDIHAAATYEDNGMGNHAYDSTVDITWSLTATWDNTSSACYAQVGFVEFLN